MKPIRLYRIGSDPELAFTTVKEYDHQIVPANTVISNNKTLALASFIGTDNHQATAEFRPPASHNIRSQILASASAIQAVDEFLRGSVAFKDVRMAASPFVAGEPLGGHIHLSFFFEDEKYRKLLSLGINLAGKWVTSTWNSNGVPPAIPNDPATMELLESIKNKAAKGNLPTPFKVAEVLNYLLLPLEWWLQLWGSRHKRNAKYGLAVESQARWNAGTPPNLAPFKNWAYLHYEYRTPSTWLCHPWMAYLYFALLKLTVVNWQLVSETAPRNHAQEVYELGGPEPLNENARQIFEKRFEALRPKLRWTTDTKDIPLALDHALKYRQQWVDPYRGVMVDAWKELLK